MRLHGLIIGLLSMMFLTIACNMTGDTSSSTPTPPLAGALIPTRIATDTPQPTPTPTLTLTLTPTVTSSPTATSTEPPSPTPRQESATSLYAELPEGVQKVTPCQKRIGEAGLCIQTQGDPQIKQILADSDLNFTIGDPSWSGDGKQMVVSAQEEAQRPPRAELHIVNVETGDLTLLVEGGFNLHPAWSPDGKWIVYRNNCQLALIRPDGGKAIKIGDGRSSRTICMDFPQWSPDSTKILAVRLQRENLRTPFKERSIVMIDLETRRPTVLLESIPMPGADCFVGDIAFSPSGDEIAFFDDNCRVRLANVENPSTRKFMEAFPETWLMRIYPRWNQITLSEEQIATLLNNANQYIDSAQEQDYVAARMIYEQVLAVQPDNITALENMGYIALKVDELSTARTWYEQALTLNNESDNALYNLGVIARIQQRYDDALSFFKRLEALMPDDAETLYEIGIVYLDTARYDEALTYLNQAIENNALFYDAYGERGRVYESMENPTLALADYQTYMDNLGDNALPEIVERYNLLKADITTTPETANITPEPTTADEVIIISDSETYEYPGQINADTFEKRFQFDALEGDSIGLQMTATDGELDAYVLLLNSKGDVLAENDDDPQGSGRDAYLRGYRIPEDGTYIAVATRFQQELGTTAGDFIFRLVRGDDTENGALSNDGTPVTMTYGDTQIGSISENAPLIQYVFDGQAGDIVNIHLKATSGDLDPYLIVSNSARESLFENDDDPRGGDKKDAFLREIVLPASGTYYITVTRFQQELGATAGDFELTLEQVQKSA